MTEKVRRQILAIRDSGEINMLDTNIVQCTAYYLGFYELVVYIEEYRSNYFRFIMTGKEK